ncbi:MAG: hypothetical protein K2X31_01810 [Sphingopyxis sp.]|nr:hypothetical protein [Sphingopyxis sp.]
MIAAAFARLSPLRAGLILWLLVSAAMLASGWGSFTHIDTVDPDDALRLVQVRDLIAGQAWWDVSQYRINPAGGGGLMHWSRLVDAPIAAGVLILTPVIGQALAESIVAAAIPLILLGLLFALFARVAASLGTRIFAIVATALLATDYMILYQFAPLRIDHHGWQIYLSLALLALLLRAPRASDGALAGVVGAALLAISLEGLPAIALFAAIMAAEWIWTGSLAAQRRLTAYLATLAAAAMALQFLTRGPDALVQTWCDALSLPYLAALATAALLVGALAPTVDRRWPSMVARIALLGVAGAASLAALLGTEPACAAGPFAALDPSVVTYWYANVREGLPVWSELDRVTGFAVAPLITGLIGTWLGWRGAASDSAMQRRWLILAAAVAGMSLLALLVLRTASVAHLYALPGCAMLGLALWARARAIASTIPRVFASIASAIALPPASGALMAALILAIVPADAGEAGGNAAAKNAPPCVDDRSVAALNRLPPMVVLAPLDIGPHILQRTHHAVVATGHHRNNEVMAASIAVFVGPPAEAEGLARANGAQLIVVCPAAQEFANFRDADGEGLADLIAAGRIPGWMEEVAMPEGASLKVWRVRQP